MWSKLRKLDSPPTTEAALEIVRSDGSISTDIKEILEKWFHDISYLFSSIRDNPSMAFNNQFHSEILKKKNEFESLMRDYQMDPEYDSGTLNNTFTFMEVSKVIDSCKNGKAYLEIPNEAAKNQSAKTMLHNFFNLCFVTGRSPTDWNYSEIKPIPKKDKDARHPLNNRCITIMCCIAKMYSKLLNNRLQKFLEENEWLVNEQNGFRAGRSCLDHIFTLVTILRNRKLMGDETFLAFIDFHKAFDSVERGLLLYKLSRIGISGNFYLAITSLYSNPMSKVILQEFETEFFGCPMGVKQGDCLSPTLFCIFIHDLAEDLKASNLGVEIDQGILINVLLYAEDIVFIAKDEGGGSAKPSYDC